MKNWIFVCLYVFIQSLAFAQNAELGKKYTEISAGYSISPPKNWQITKHPKSKYSIFKGEPDPDNMFYPNINFVIEKHNGILKDYIDHNLKMMPKFLTEFKLIERKKFTTDSGLSGEYIRYKDTQHLYTLKLTLRQTAYFFRKEDKVIIITCTAWAEGGEKFDQLFSQSIKTFNWFK
jgi:hypothetical protein